jgi:hypothetical protein
VGVGRGDGGVLVGLGEGGVLVGLGEGGGGVGRTVWDGVGRGAAAESSDEAAGTKP